MMTIDPDAEDIEIQLFVEAIQARYGYDLRGYDRSSMRRRVLAALASSGFGNLGELQHYLLHDVAVFARVLDALTVRVSDVFRDGQFFRVFRREVVPLLRMYPLIKIWHSGC